MDIIHNLQNIIHNKKHFCFIFSHNICMEVRYLNTKKIVLNNSANTLIPSITINTCSPEERQNTSRQLNVEYMRANVKMQYLIILFYFEYHISYRK